MGATMEIYKTRKMVQASEVKADQLGLERSEQLRKLYRHSKVYNTADSKVFPRSLLANASLLTVVCFPFLEGVPRIGTTEHAAIHSIWRERNARRHDEPSTDQSLLARNIDKHIRNRIDSMRGKLHKKYDKAMQLWFASR
ncbi:hypothetical protein F2Q68_00005912 [Brassica cretica]|uniref:Uncharacterized protein n=1 Tax=Brassica cretica TaxID=69181 RepID=A0A8S9JFR4_BRACR|nr:hypothetical protein F2Q68_00005912 [Brassica cretica]